MTPNPLDARVRKRKVSRSDALEIANTHQCAGAESLDEGWGNRILSDRRCGFPQLYGNRAYIARMRSPRMKGNSP